jgi:hypothetical protein
MLAKHRGAAPRQGYATARCSRNGAPSGLAGRSRAYAPLIVRKISRWLLKKNRFVIVQIRSRQCFLNRSQIRRAYEARGLPWSHSLQLSLLLLAPHRRCYLLGFGWVWWRLPGLEDNSVKPSVRLSGAAAVLMHRNVLSLRRRRPIRATHVVASAFSSWLPSLATSAKRRSGSRESKNPASEAVRREAEEDCGRP